jgi:hypothetical protein
VNGYSVALSTKNTIAHVKNDTTDIEAKIFPLSSVLSFDLTANGTRIQTFEPGTKIGSAAIGGLLFGGAGAVVGAIVGNRGGTKSSNITTVGVKFLIGDTSAPSFEIVAAKGLEIGSEELNSAKGQVQEFCDQLEVQLHKIRSPKSVATKEQNPNQPPKKTRSKNQGKTVPSFADEITKLLELKNTGVISEQEFEVMKKSVIERAIEK